MFVSPKSNLGLDMAPYKCILLLYIIMFADDTVLLTDSPDLQIPINTMKDYCSMFDLDINIDKTKVMIFSRG